jgi:D-xylose 1-dehydrogenase (NADP+, D-xylono-1,5-lactone-forming)
MRRLKWGVLGCADIGLRAMVPALQAGCNCEVVAVASRDAERARQVAARLGLHHTYGDYQSLVEDPDVEAVYIPLPNSLHAEWAVRAAQCGKHVLCEKPLALTAGDVDAIAAAATEHKVLAMEAMMYRLHPQTLKAWELVRAGTLGAVHLVQANFTYHVPNPSDIRFNRALGGGVLEDVGSYCVSVARAAMGCEPTQVTGEARIGPASDVDEAFTGMLRFPGGELASFACSIHGPRQQEYRITGSEASLTVTVPFAPGVDDRLLILRRGWQRGKETVEQIVVPGVDQYRLLGEHFADCVLNGTAPAIPLSETRANVAAVSALHESSLAGKPVLV